MKATASSRVCAYASQGAYGYIQSKAIYPTQDELMAAANGYRETSAPSRGFVVDFLNMSKQGQMDLDPSRCRIQLR